MVLPLDRIMHVRSTGERQRGLHRGWLYKKW